MAAASRSAESCVRPAPSSTCLMLTSFADDDALYASVMAGAAGYVLKQIKARDLSKT